jgi:hypothetical protein
MTSPLSNSSFERDDLICPFCKSKVWDNRFRKQDPAQPSFHEKTADFICENNACPRAKQGKVRMLRPSWYLFNTDGTPNTNIPKEWNI